MAGDRPTRILTCDYADCRCSITTLHTVTRERATPGPGEWFSGGAGLRSGARGPRARTREPLPSLWMTSRNRAGESAQGWPRTGPTGALWWPREAPADPDSVTAGGRAQSRIQRACRTVLVPLRSATLPRALSSRTRLAGLSCGSGLAFRTRRRFSRSLPRHEATRQRDQRQPHSLAHGPYVGTPGTRREKSPTTGRAARAPERP